MEMHKLPENKKIIIFDGVCNLCNGAINFIIKRDKKDIFRFVSLQSNLGRQISNKIAVNQQEIDSIILFDPEEGFITKSEAAFKIANHLGIGYKLLSVFKIIPLKLRNNIYDFVAKNRYKWFGKTDACRLPDANSQEKFMI